ncbi:MAG: hypothetical protein Q8M29_00090 [Bacteroidota bacterium]|nr:hypothetical protein [Bacteroidota bacterium]
MQNLIAISLTCLFTFSPPQAVKYDVLFADEYKNALNYTSKNVDAFKQSSIKYNNDPQLLTSIVFPELMRYSLIKDILETSALELAYIDGGCEVADFSIGRFQMKPSFVEDLERQIETNDSLKKVYSIILSFKSSEEKTIRAERLKRLSSLNWQVIYLNCFASVVKNKFPEQTFATVSDKIMFYSSAYNGGYHKTAKQIVNNECAKYYPYGTKYKGDQYSYAAVADYFYIKTYKQKTLSLKPDREAALMPLKNK